MAKSKQTIEALMAECASLGLPISTNKDGLTQILQVTTSVLILGVKSLA